MKKTIVCVIICLFNLPAFAIDYKDFPPDLQKILDLRIAEVNTNGGFCVAGVITMSDGARIRSGEDVMVNFCNSIDEPLWVYKDGWFIMGRALQSEYARERGKLRVRALGYEPNDVSITIPKGEITYIELGAQKTSPEDLASIEGVVLNDQNEPFSGARISLGFPFANHGYRSDTGDTYSHREMTTGQNGQYSFKGLSSAEHTVTAYAGGCAYHSIRFTSSAGEAATKNLKLYRNRKITIDYVYQADGNRSFTEGDLTKGTVEWVNGHDGMDFSEGKAVEHQERDLEMRQDQDELKFQIFYSNGSGNGIYDEGEVDFESITEADENNHYIGAKPCIIGHVYVVKTYENNFAKFIVKSISVSK